jgi:DNA-directed RNA polymerase specialized sigma subunit
MMQARRLERLRLLWLTDLSLVLIAERLGVTVSYVSELAKRAGLPPRHG